MNDELPDFWNVWAVEIILPALSDDDKICKGQKVFFDSGRSIINVSIQNVNIIQTVAELQRLISGLITFSL